MAGLFAPGEFCPSVLVDRHGTRNQQTAMVNKREKNEGAKKTPVITTPKRRSAAKPTAAARVVPTAPARPARKKAAKPVSPSPEDVAFRAYLIGEKRQQLGLPGDSLSDWVEAERQLLSEPATHGVN